MAGATGRVYAAPTLIWHYVTEHGYRPPDEFIDAVLADDPDLFTWARMGPG